MDAFNEWEKDVQTDPMRNAMPTRLVYRSFFDLAQVQQIVVENYDSNKVAEITEAFSAELPTSGTMGLLTKEYMWTQMQRNTMNRIASYPCVNAQHIESKIQGYMNALDFHINNLETLTGAQILELRPRSLKVTGRGSLGETALPRKRWTTCSQSALPAPHKQSWSLESLLESQLAPSLLAPLKVAFWIGSTTT